MGLSPFVWGQGGRAVTPEQLARDREIAQALLAQAGDTSPVGHWAQGAARVANAISGKIQLGRADRAMAEGQAGARSRLQQALAGGGGGGSVASALGGGQAAAVSAPSTMSVPTGERAQYIRAGLIQRGLPEHIADGFLANFKDESGLDPGINERNPTVPGSRGGFGLYQLTGPRRTAYENYVQQAGLNAGDIDPQLDFLLSELKGPESKAWGQINASTDAAGAAQAIVNSFLRPAESHRAERAARYAGLGPSQASLESLPVGGATQMAQAAPAAAQPTMGVSQALLQAASDPFLPKQDQAVAQALIEQQMAAQTAEAERIAKANDPMRQLQLQKAQLEINAMQQPARQSLINAGDGRLYDPNSGAWIEAPNSGQRGFRQATPEEASKYGAAAGQFGPDDRFYPVNPPQGTSLSVDPSTGAVTFNQGAGVKPLTEGQSKDTVYATRAAGALPVLDQFGSSLTSATSRAAEMDPTGVVRGNLQSPEFQQAKQAGDEFLQAILRKDTGAAITSDEMSSYGRTYLPQPGDGPELLAQKQVSRTRALKALEAGMPPQAILQQERALEASSPASANAGSDVDTRIKTKFGKSPSEMTDAELQEALKKAGSK